MGRRRLGVIAVMALLVAFVRAPVAHAAIIWIWPSSASCDATLQACVDNASSGDEVLIAQSGLINEQITIRNKSLTLQAKTGFTPELKRLYILVHADVGPVTDLVAHVQSASSIQIEITGGSGHTVTVDHVTAQSSGASPGIYGFISRTSTVNVLHSSVTQTGFYPGIALTSPIANLGDLTWNVIGNTISGALASETQAGIHLDVTSVSALHADVDNNSIWDEGQGVDLDNEPGGINLFARNSGNVYFNVVGNSLDKIHGPGVWADNEQASPNSFGLDLFNNVIANTTGPAVDLVTEPDTTGPFSVLGGRNDFSRNRQPLHLAGMNIGQHFTVMPQFVDDANGNLRLSATSPLIDEGIICSPGGVAGPDAAGRNRLFGKSVDVGAYERNAGRAGLVEVGTDEPDTMFDGPQADILCGYGGDDQLFGTNGADYLDGGWGNDHIFGGPGMDRLYGDFGSDLLCADDGSDGDYLNGGRGTDSYQADPGDTKVAVEQLGDCSVA